MSQFFSSVMKPIYNVISWVLTSWHWLWDAILPNGRFLGTNWDWVLAIVFLVITVRLILFPIFVRQIKSQRAMQALAPKVKELQAKHKGDPQTLREEMMKLYQTEKVNPLMGCLPMLLQIPVFFGLFTVLRWIKPGEPDKHAYWGWTDDLFDRAASAQLFGAPIPASFSDNAAKVMDLGATQPAAAKVVAGVLVIMMMLTTFMTSRQMILKTGWQAEPQQRMIQRLMLYGIPVSLLLSGWAFPIGVVIYWVTQNLLSLAQQQWVLRKYPPMITASEPPKTARERAAAATKKDPGALARFFLVLPPPAKPAGAQSPVQGSRPGWLGTVLAKIGLGSQGTELVNNEPPPSSRSTAPRPGARPGAAARQRPARSADRTIDGEFDEVLDDEPTTPPTRATPPSRPTVGRPAAKSPAQRTGVAGSAKPAGAKPSVTPSVTPKSSVTPKPSVTSKSGAAVKPPVTGKPSSTATAKPSAVKPATSSSANGTASANGGTVSGGTVSGSTPKQSVAAGGGQARPAAKKATPARKGGQAGRKGSGRR